LEPTLLNVDPDQMFDRATSVLSADARGSGTSGIGPAAGPRKDGGDDASLETRPERRAIHRISVKA
jgi:hypothetical protein